LELTAAALPGLTNLEPGSNRFKKLPHALSLLTNLQDLPMRNNAELHLGNFGDRDTLAALPRLTRLNFERPRPGWNSAQFFVVIARTYPNLELHV